MISGVEDLRKCFEDLRVDFLNEDELDCELNVRRIKLEEEGSMVSKRGSLREHAKHEKEQNKLSDTVYELDPLLDYELCGNFLENSEELEQHVSVFTTWSFNPIASGTENG